MGAAKWNNKKVPGPPVPLPPLPDHEVSIMKDEKFTARTWFMAFLAFAITILFIMSSTALWKRNLWETVLFLTLGAALTLLFYRKKLTLLAAAACGFVTVNAGLTAVFHPSTVGIMLTVVSLAGLFFFSWRVQKQHPGLRPDDWQKVFDKK